MKNGTRFVWAFVLVQFCWGATTRVLILNRSGTNSNFPNPDHPTEIINPATQYERSLNRISNSLLADTLRSHDTIFFAISDDVSVDMSEISDYDIIIGLFGWPGSNSIGFTESESRTFREFLESNEPSIGGQKALIFEGNDLARRYADTTGTVGVFDSLLVFYFNAVYIASNPAPSYLYGYPGTCFEGLYCTYTHNSAPGGPDTTCDDVGIYQFNTWASHANYGFYGGGKDPARGIIRRTYSPGATILFSFSLANVSDSIARDGILKRAVDFSVSPLGKITYPTTGGILHTEDTVLVKYWHYDNIGVSSLKIKFRPDTVSPWSTLKNVTYPIDEDTTYQWAVPNLPSNTCYMILELEDEAKNFYQDTIGPFTILPSSEIGEYKSTIRSKYTPFPNPFNSSVFIPVISHKANVTITDLNGRTIKTLNSVANNPLIWDGTDNFGQKVSAGIYLASVEEIDKRKLFKIVFVP